MIRADFSDRVPQTFRLNLLSDTHIGNLATSYKAIETAVADIKSDRNGYWGFLGDGTESIHLWDKRFDTEIHAGEKAVASSQVGCWVECFEPILGRLLFYLEGNHERKIKGTEKISKAIIEKIKDKHGIEGILHGGVSIRAKFSEDFRLFATHGAGQVNSQAGDRKQVAVNNAIKVKRKLRHKAGDCIVMAMAHIHKLVLHEPSEWLHLVGDKKSKAVYPIDFVSSSGAIHEDCRWYCATGSFLKGRQDDITTYVEEAMYDPTELGYIQVFVERGKVVKVEKRKIL